MLQTIISGPDSSKQLKNIVEQIGCSKILLVCGSSFDSLGLTTVLETLPCPYVRFSHFTANPQYPQIVEGVEVFKAHGCDAVLAVGGGSAMDVAKCIKLFCKMDSNSNFLQQMPVDTGIPLIAIPTTAGTGSESTRYAVIYYEGIKQSVMHESILPEYAILDAGVLKHLPVYQKKCTMLDALSQAVESWWSVHANDESKTYAKEAIGLILGHYRKYLDEGDSQAAAQMLLGANLAGRAIHITQTTAVHAMSYKMTSLYGLPHGHAVGIGLPVLMEHMIAHVENCIDSRGEAYLQETLGAIARCFGQETPEACVSFLNGLLGELEIARPCITAEQLEILTHSVHSTRLRNHPVLLDESAIYQLYQRIGVSNGET